MNELSALLSGTLSEQNDTADCLRNGVIIYGAGGWGKQLYHDFLSSGIPVKAFLDKNAPPNGGLLNDTPLINPYLSFPEEYLNFPVVISVFLRRAKQEAIINDVIALGFKKVLSCYDIVLPYRMIDIGESKQITQNYYAEHKDHILRAAQLLKDEKSLQVYTGCIAGHALNEAAHFPAPDDEDQYFPQNIPFSKGYDRFVDCGAYTGDTVQALVRNKGKVEHLALFEPDPHTFVGLSRTIDENLDNIARQVVLFPCGVWNETVALRFKQAGGSSGISMDGEHVIQCSAIDDTLKGFAPTFIKMDIEGAEYNALLGAKRTIKKYLPDLAISVYHCASDLWRIPLLIESFDPSYQFYLRNYWERGYETILYAVSNSNKESEVI